MRKLVLLMVTLLVLAGCAAKSGSGVISDGPDTYLVSRKAASSFSDLDKLKAGAFQEASEFCLSQNKNIHVVKIYESPPHVFGNLPRAEIQFKCLEKTDTDSPSP